MKISQSIARDAGTALTAVAMLAFTFAPFAALADGNISAAHSAPASHTAGGNGASPAEGHLTVITKVADEDATNPIAHEWTMVVTNMTDATHPVVASFPGSEKGHTIDLKAGTYEVTEKDGPAGYGNDVTNSCLVTIKLGKTSTCTIVNHADANNGTAPVAQSMHVTTNMDAPVAIHLNAIAADNGTLTYKVSAPEFGVLSGTAPDLVYTPNPLYNGTDSFTFSVTDGTAKSNTASVAITVNLVQGHGMAHNGQVLGAATSTVACVPTITKYLRPDDAQNDVDQVKALQTLLNKDLSLTLPVSGNYDDATTGAVKAFQTKYASDILTPWGITEPTGIVYITTVAALDKIDCPTNAQGIPPLVVWTSAQGN